MYQRSRLLGTRDAEGCTATTRVVRATSTPGSEKRWTSGAAVVGSASRVTRADRASRAVSTRTMYDTPAANGKRGVRTNDESGAPLVAGRRYRLVIDNEWPDGAGAALASGFEHAFEAVDADRSPVDPARWRLTTPAAGARAPLSVVFGEPMDHALASRMIAVYDASGRPVAGAASLSADDAFWLFAPEHAWQAGDYTLRVTTILEDVAGNSVARAFDVDRRSSDAPTRTVPGDSVRVVRFRVGARGNGSRGQRP